MFSKYLFLILKNVHPILDFLTRRGKFISYFSDFYLFFYAIFPAELILKKIRARADWAKGPADGPPRGFLSPHGSTPAGVRACHGSRRRLGAGLPESEPPPPLAVVAPASSYPFPKPRLPPHL